MGAIHVDVGGSEIRASLVAGGVLAWSGSEPAPGLLISTRSRAGRVAEALAGLLDGIPPPVDDPVRDVLIGMSGWTDHRDVNGCIADRVHHVTGAPSVIVAHDALTMYLGAMGVRAGAAIAAGTGVVAVAWNEDEAVRSDGWGELLGDAGGAFDIGRSLLRAATAYVDGRGGSAVIASLVASEVGDLGRLPERLSTTANVRAAVAELAPLAFRAATEGDVEAGRICRQAATDLATTVISVVERAFAESAATVTVRYSGGLFAAGPTFVDTFVAEVARRTTRVEACLPAHSTGLEGAALLPAAAALPGLGAWSHRFSYA